MKTVLSYLKKSTVAIIAIVGLLVAQAMLDLSLPEYTSKIVNIGVQQGGIEDSVSTAIRESEMKKLFLFIGEADTKTVLENYTLISKETLSEKEYQSKVKKYPVLEKEAIYERNQIDSAIKKKLNTILSKPMLLVTTFESDQEEIVKIKDQILAGFPAGTDIFTAFQLMPKESLGKIIAKFDEQVSAMPESIVSQSGTIFVKNEYKQIGMNTDKIQTNYIFVSGAKMLGIALLSMCTTILVGFLGARVAARMGRDLRKGVFKKVVSFSNNELKQFSTASLITRSTNDIQQIQMMTVMVLRTIIYAPILGVGGFLKVINTNTSMSWIIAVALLTILSIVILLFAIVMPKFKIVQNLIDKLNLVTREILTGIPVIRAFSTQKHEEKRFDKANKTLTKTNLFVNRMMGSMMPLMMLVMNAVSIAIIWNGAHGIDAGTMQVGDMMAFIQYTMQIIMSFLMISMVSIMLPRAAVSMNRIGEVLNTDLAIHDPEKPKEFIESKKGMVEFKDVSFRYPDAEVDVITNINFTAEPGKTTAFIGSTGSGKSTLINLIPRFFDVTKGSIQVDGIDIRDVNVKDLRKRIGYVPQKGILFSGTIESNVKYGDEKLPKEMVQKALSIAQATDFVSEMPKKEKAPIAQGGTNVSGGQKQRLSIARAVAINPEIYIFDDSFSALDFKTDAALRKALHDETKGSTMLIVAQRISTIMNADQIVVLDEGKMVGRGTHQELLKTCDVYRQIAESQLSKEELENE